MNDRKSDSPSDVSGGTLDGVLSPVMTILMEAGPDAVHLGAVAAAAGFSFEELEETFGHPGELLHLAWERELRHEFDLLVSQAVQIMSRTPGDVNVDPRVGQRMRAAVHLLVVAHRFDELREVVPFDVQRILYRYEHDAMDSADRSTLRALIGWLVGIALEPGSRFSDSLQLLKEIGWTPGCWRVVDGDDEVESTPPVPLVFDEVGEMSQEILGACTRIIAQGGLARATLLRIARMAGYPPEVLYGLYGRQEYLVGHYLKLVLSLLFSYRRFEWLMSAPAVAAMRIEVWLQPDVQTRRRALLECVLASNFHPHLASAYSTAAEEALMDQRLALLLHPELDVRIARLRFLASRQLTLGLAVLEDAELEKQQRVWRPFLRVFLGVSD